MKHFAIIILIYLAAVLETALTVDPRTAMLCPALLAMTVALAMRVTPGPAAVLWALFAGLIADCIGSGPLGAQAFAFVFAGAAVTLLKGRAPDRAGAFGFPIALLSLCLASGAADFGTTILGDPWVAGPTLLLHELLRMTTTVLVAAVVAVPVVIFQSAGAVQPAGDRRSFVSTLS